MRRSSSAFVRRTHSSSISRQAQLLPITSTVPLPPPSPPEIRSSASPTPSTEKVKEWVDIFDGPMRPAAFVPRPTSPPPTSASTPTRDGGDKGVNSIIFDGPARPRYIIPGAYAQPPKNERGPPARGEMRKGSVSGTDVAALLSRSSLPPPRIYDGPAFEWELQTKRV